MQTYKKWENETELKRERREKMRPFLTWKTLQHEGELVHLWLTILSFPLFGLGIDSVSLARCLRRDGDVYPFVGHCL